MDARTVPRSKVASLVVGVSYGGNATSVKVKEEIEVISEGEER